MTLVDPRPHEALDREVDHRAVVHREEVLVGHERERACSRVPSPPARITPFMPSPPLRIARWPLAGHRTLTLSNPPRTPTDRSRHGTLHRHRQSLDEIKQAHELGVLDGVTTNPSLIAKEGVDYTKRLAEICEVVKGPVSAEVIAVDYDGMIREGRDRAKIAENIVVKLPSTLAGLRACKTLSDEGTRTNLTLCFQPLQAMLVAKAGAFLVSPFIGRLDDIGQDGMTLIHEIRQVYDNFGYSHEAAGGVDPPPDARRRSAPSQGLTSRPMPFDVIKKMLNHPLTDIGLEKFVADYQKAFG